MRDKWGNPGRPTDTVEDLADYAAASTQLTKQLVLVVTVVGVLAALACLGGEIVGLMHEGEEAATAAPWTVALVGFAGTLNAAIAVGVLRTLVVVAWSAKEWARARSSPS